MIYGNPKENKLLGVSVIIEHTIHTVTKDKQKIVKKT